MRSHNDFQSSSESLLKLTGTKTFASKCILNEYLIIKNVLTCQLYHPDPPDDRPEPANEKENDCAELWEPDEKNIHD